MTENRVEKAVSYFENGLSCAQAIFTTYGPVFGISESCAVRISCGLGGGVAHLAQTCGAVTGASLVLGLKCEENTELQQAKTDTYNLVQNLAARFEKVNGSLNCRQLTGCDLNDPNDMDRFKNGIKQSRCYSYVRLTAEMLEELLELRNRSE